MNIIYTYILEFINAFFPNDLSIELLKLNELLAYIVTLVFVFVLIKSLLKLFKVIK